MSPKEERFVNSYVRSGRAPNKAAVGSRALEVIAKEDVRNVHKPKKISRGLQQALREVAEGKLAGPFDTVEELMRDLRS